jgi:hypothetical protein
MVDWNIAAQGNRPNFGAAIDQGMQAYSYQQKQQQQNALQAYLQQNAQAIMAGDQNALSGLVPLVGPEAAMNISGELQRQKFAGKADRRAGMESQTNITDTKERLKLAQAQAKAEMDLTAVKMSAAQRAEAADKIEAIAADATQIDSAKEWDDHFGSMGPEFKELVGKFGEKKFYEAKALGTLESLRGQAPEKTTAMQTLEERADAAGLAQGSPERKDFMLNGGIQRTQNVDRTFRPATPEEAKGYGASAGQIDDSTGRFYPAQVKETSTTADERKATGYYERMVKASDTLAKLAPGGTHQTLVEKGLSKVLPEGYANSQHTLQIKQAQRDWVRAKLRWESGAVIGDAEADEEAKTYFPQPGEEGDVVAQKDASRKQAEEQMKTAAGRGVQDTPAAAGPRTTKSGIVWEPAGPQ